LSNRTCNDLPWSWWSPDQAGGDYANPAEIGYFMLSYVAAYEMRQPWSPPQTTVMTQLTATLDQLRSWQSDTQTEQPNGQNAYENSVFYRWYWVCHTPPVVGASPADHEVSSIDNAFLAASLITIHEWAETNDAPGVEQQADAILQEMDFRIWYDEGERCFRHGRSNDPLGGICWDYYSNENRIINFVVRALGQLSTEEYQESLDILAQNPATYTRPAPHAPITAPAVAWDGSYFTYTAPTLFIREMETPYAETIERVTEAQIAYAQDRGYTAWGFTDCFDETGAYVQQGAPPVAMPGTPETRPGLVSPHASALALLTSYADAAIDNLQFLSTFHPNPSFDPVYDIDYGFRDCVRTSPGHHYGAVSPQFSALAQEYILLSIANMRTQFIWRKFYRDTGVLSAHSEMFGTPLVDG
jgi:hypothetical protein